MSLFIRYYPIWEKIRDSFNNNIPFKNRNIFIILIMTAFLSWIIVNYANISLILCPDQIISNTTLIVPIVVLVLGAFFYKFKSAFETNERDPNIERNRMMRDEFRINLVHLIILILFSIVLPFVIQNLIQYNKVVLSIISCVYLVGIIIILYESWRLAVKATGIDYSIGCKLELCPSTSCDCSIPRKS